MGWMWIGWMLVVVVAVAAIWFAARAARRGGDRPEPPRRRDDESPQEILERRYARGEIDRETFERMRDDLTST